MKLGADRKRIVVLGSLIAVGGYLFYANVLSDSGAPPAGQGSAAPPAAVPATRGMPAAVPQEQVRRVGSRVRSSEEWHPTLKRRADDPLDPLTVDPTLRLELLAKVQAVQLDGGARNVFQFSLPPAPPLPKEPKILPKTPEQLAQEVQAAKPAGPPQPPPPAPILLKYYGFSTARGTARKTAFFLDGEDILVAAEGEMVKRRYKVVRIGVNSVVMEDTESKSQQTLPLQEEAVG